MKLEDCKSYNGPVITQRVFTTTLGYKRAEVTLTTRLLYCYCIEKVRERK